jgi:tRNA U34 5-carboxymethylaminomethyl modifying GTPase MnmE/TrmE
VPNLRQKKCLEGALEALLRAEDLLQTGAYGELISMELHTACKQLDAILGGDTDGELLDRIFAGFCVGK